MNQVVAGKQRTGARMQSIECCRMVASALIVFLHCQSSGEFGSVMNCLARVVVPFFFAVSGYFAYHVSEKTIKKRLWSVLKLNIVVHLFYLLWDGYRNGIRDFLGLANMIGSVYSDTTLSKILILNRSPVRGFLWYLNAIVFCYLALWLYVRWAEDEKCNYKPLYITTVCLYSIQIVLGSIATASELEIPYHTYRNVLLFGLPMFALGLFLRENTDKILRAYKLNSIKLIGLIVAGALLSILQWRGTGSVEMPVGTLLEVIALILLLVSNPVVSGNSRFLAGIISTFGRLSTYVYVTHMFWAELYIWYLKEYIQRLGEAQEAFLYPFLVIGITMGTGVVYMCMLFAVKIISEKIRDAVKADKY